MARIPHPPVKTMTDFVVFCFVSVIVIVLVLTAVGIFVADIVDPGGDRSNVTNALSDIITTLIGALVGFIAGKGQGRHEIRSELEELDKEKPNET